MRKLVIALCFVLMSCISAYAQTGPQVQWDQDNVASATQAQGLIYTLYVTPVAGSTIQVTLSSVLCGGQLPKVQCATVLPQSAGVATVTGSKSELTARDSTGGTPESARSLPFLQPAAVPINLKITK